ncbi:hypothetical protein [Sutcliffiella horikoshii]|nr:hypothetical protein [Sutcliffiella horikoshii]
MDVVLGRVIDFVLFRKRQQKCVKVEHYTSEVEVTLGNVEGLQIEVEPDS